tara:strand:+ start:258 stop:458 length:201 start_codon:yes stop_codon:yes gene_type:complete
MKVSITFTPDCEDDGFDGTTTVERNSIDDLYGLGYAFAEAARAAGYTYVNVVAFEKDDGSMIFSEG